LQFALEACGARVLAVSSSAEAWELAFGTTRPDVILSDVGLPDEDGYAFLRRLRAEELQLGAPRIAAVALTAYASPLDRKRALSAGFDRHVSKPLALEDLIATIGVLLRGPAAPVE
jgi:CheY-like chemotaxis protein